MEDERKILAALARLDRQRVRKAGKTPHLFEEAHDEPSCSSDTCWDCLLPRAHPIHAVVMQRKWMSRDELLRMYPPATK